MPGFSDKFLKGWNFRASKRDYVKKAKPIYRLFLGIGIAALLTIGCPIVTASGSGWVEEYAAVDAGQFADFIEHEVLDLDDLAEGAEIQRRRFNRMTPPGVSWVQPMVPPVAPFDAEFFDDLFLSELLGEDKNSVAVFPLSLALDPQTRETLVYNADGLLIAVVPADPVVREWREDADPARVTLQLDLLPMENVEPYLYTERRIAEYNEAQTAEATKAGGTALRGLGSNEFGIAGIQRMSNGNMQITVSNGMGTAEVFAYTVWHTSSVSVVVWTNEYDEVLTNSHTVWHPTAPAFDGTESEWECLTTNLALVDGVGVFEDTAIPPHARLRFYAVANPLDSDGDGLSDAAERLVHKTDPHNPDTDGDGVSDGVEVAMGSNPLDAASTPVLDDLDEALAQVNTAQIGYLCYLCGLPFAYDSSASYAQRISQLREMLEALLGSFLDLEVNTGGMLAERPGVVVWKLESVLTSIGSDSDDWLEGLATTEQVGEIVAVLEKLTRLVSIGEQQPGHEYQPMAYHDGAVQVGNSWDLGTGLPKRWPTNQPIQTCLLLDTKVAIPMVGSGTVDDWILVNKSTRFPATGSIYTQHVADISTVWNPDGTNTLALWDCGDCAGTNNYAYLSPFSLIHVLDVPVLSVDLEIYKPKVIDPVEPMIPDADELSKGSVTFVNLDNDDNDSKFDHGGAFTDDEVTGGDDELVKVKLKLKPSSLTEGEVKLLATAGGGNIAVWTNNTKAAASAYTLGTVLNVPGDFTVEGDSLVKTMWVEGISAHTAQQGTKLKMEYTINGTTCEDEAALTVVGVDQISWKGKSNSLNDNDTLDADPNWPGGLTPNALRVFPGARFVNGAVEANPRDVVNVEVSLTVAPPHPIKLYLRSFDVDDPTSASSPVDDEANEEDNRGDVAGRKSGIFSGEDASGILELLFQENVTTTNCEFQVTMQPGDNFRIVASGDKDFLLRLENNDSMQNVGASDAEKNANKQRICNMDVTGTPAEREIRLPGNYASDVLTVWRFLHVEVDSMAAPPTTGPEKNFVDGNLTGVVGNGTVAQRVNLSVNLKTGHSPQDNSANLDSSPSGNGRFENGWIKIGSGGGTPGETQTSDLLGNGDDYVCKVAGIDIPVLVSKTGQSDVSGKVIAWCGAAFTLSVSSGTLSSNYNGGSLNVAGVSAAITTVSGTNVVNVSAAPTIPFVLHDDDVASMPRMPDIDVLSNIVADAYVKLLNDGGGNPANNKNNVPFVRNSDAETHAGLNAVFSLTGALESDANRAPRFWVGYIMTIFQNRPDTAGPHGRGDSDPDTESGLGGSNGTKGAVVIHETILEYQRSYSWDGSHANLVWGRVTAHELGHQLGCPDRSVGNGIMSADLYNPGDIRFIPDDLHIIRSRITSPGN